MYMRVETVALSLTKATVTGKLVVSPTDLTEVGTITFDFDNDLETYKPGQYYEVNLWYKS